MAKLKMNTATMSKSILKLYKSYNFVDKDPIIYEIGDLIRLRYNFMDYATVHAESGVAISTLKKWFHGKTQRPQHATVEAVIRGLGFQRKITDPTNEGNVVQFPKRRRKR